MDDKRKDSWFQRLLYKYRLSIMNEDTLTEQWYLRISWLGAVVVGMVLFLLTLALLSVLIIFTPIRTILPGYTEDIRQQLVVANEKVDSLSTSMEVQRQYLGVIQQVLAGEIKSDTVQSLDSMQLIMREELLMAKSQATEEFIAQYESAGHDNLQLFEVQESAPALSMFRPVHGVVTTSFADDAEHAITIQTPKNENVTAVLAGAIVHIRQQEDGTYMIIGQHAQYIAIYYGLGRVLRQTGDYVQAGATLGIVSDEVPFRFELWENGKVIDPESVIAF